METAKIPSRGHFHYKHDYFTMEVGNCPILHDLGAISQRRRPEQLEIQSFR